MCNCTETFKSGIRDSAFAVLFKFWISIRLRFIKILLSMSLKIEMFYTITWIVGDFGLQRVICLPYLELSRNEIQKMSMN